MFAMHSINALKLSYLSLIGLMASLLIANDYAIQKIIETYFISAAKSSDSASTRFGKSNQGLKQNINLMILNKSSSSEIMLPVLKSAAWYSTGCQQAINPQ